MLDFQRKLRFGWIRLVLGSSALLLSTSASAAPTSAEERALAEALFREGKALLEAGDSAAACKKLEESRRLENAGGTVIALAICYEYDGRSASAWAEFQVALELARRAGREDRVQLATERIAALEKTLHWVSVHVTEANRRLANFRVERNESPVPPGSWGTRVALDPGQHLFVASATGYVSWKQTLVVTKEPGETSLEVPSLERAVEPPPPTTVPLEPKPESKPSERRGQPRDDHATERTIGFVLLGTGAAALLTAGYFGLKSVAARSRVAGGCVENQCGEQFEADYAAAQDSDRTAVIAASAGLLLGGAGTYLLVTSSPRDNAESKKGFGTRDWIGVSLMGAGAASVVVGGVFAVQGVADSNRIWGECERGPCDDADLQSFDRAIQRQTAGIVLASIGAVSTMAGVYLFSTPSGASSSNAQRQLRPWVRASLGTLTAGGSF